jgi:hypothetical protein
MEPGKEDLSGKVEQVEQKLDTHMKDDQRHLKVEPPVTVQPVKTEDLPKAKAKGSWHGDPVIVIGD